MDWFLYDRDLRHERVDPFHATGLFLYPLITSKTSGFLMFSGRKRLLTRNGLKKTSVTLFRIKDNHSTRRFDFVALLLIFAQYFINKKRGTSYISLRMKAFNKTKELFNKALFSQCEQLYQEIFYRKLHLWRSVCMLNQPFKRQPHKMVEHTQTIRRQTADKLCDCVWPFCGVCSALVLNYLEMCYWFQTVSKLFIMVLHLLCRGEKRHGLTFVIQRCKILIRN